MRLLHHSDRGKPPDEATPEGNNSLYCFNFLTKRPRIRTYPGFETPKPLLIEMNRGDGDLMTIMRDVLALTKINYNACDYASGLPVTLKFADRVGEILTASPRGLEAPPMPFRFYI
jgi:hypothetical protein